ncbi:transcriptional regulator (plasmid) [Calothrix sp. NIES-4071]|nr:transcriptional regulator [Calothrix sp. NIES-4071]BAZ64635.1 transcriptional regulator [Calothrix sp. NIES-4105]
MNILAKCIDTCQYRGMPIAKLISKCCSPLLSGFIKPAEAEQMASLFRVLGEPARLRLISLIAVQPKGEACVCQLMEPLGLSQPTVSHHLKVLYEIGLLEREQRGTRVYYRLIHERIEALRNALVIPNQSNS